MYVCMCVYVRVYVCVCVTRDATTCSSCSLLVTRLFADEMHHCKFFIDAHGVTEPYIPDVPGAHLLDRYDTMPTNISEYEGQTVMILGRGNAAFETAQAIMGATALLHVVSQ